MAKLEVDLLHTMDATVWAEEFNRITGGDKELMLGWFANAIMAGYDEANRRCKASLIDFAGWLSVEIDELHPVLAHRLIDAVEKYEKRENG